MSSITITFEIHYKSVLETTTLFAVFLAAAIFVVTRTYRRLFKPLNYGEFNADPSYYRKPIPEENQQNTWKVWGIWF